MMPASESMQTFKTIQDYCQAINIPAPKHPSFDIRRFEDNMRSVVSAMPPFRHEFYAIALKIEGGGKAISGHHTDFPENSTVFFNSPFQILSWEIVPDWEGYYIMFTQDFVAQSYMANRLLDDFPFLKIDKAIPFEIKRANIPPLLSVYKNIFEEYDSEAADKFQLIESYTLLLLQWVKRLASRRANAQEVHQEIRKADLKLLSRFQALIEMCFQPEHSIRQPINLHSPKHYAQQLNIHPNHLNAIVKSITGHTAKQHIHKHLIQLAKTQLRQSTLSIKEIAYSLYFESPNNFSSFFKKHTQQSPKAYRNHLNL